VRHEYVRQSSEEGALQREPAQQRQITGVILTRRTTIGCGTPTWQLFDRSVRRLVASTSPKTGRAPGAKSGITEPDIARERWGESMADRTSTELHAPELRGFRERVERAIRLTEQLNSLPYGDQDGIRATWAELTEQPLDETLHLIPPVYSDHGINIRLGHNVFVNQGCRLNDIGGIVIEDDVMIGPSVSLITSGHPVDPSSRRSGITAAPIRIGRSAWIGASAMILQGVTVGANSVVGAGAVVTHDIPPATLAVGVPARVVRDIG
jgi:acetyltransferase-like isoleucine patch superfamily enzyme